MILNITSFIFKTYFLLCGARLKDKIYFLQFSLNHVSLIIKVYIFIEFFFVIIEKTLLMLLVIFQSECYISPTLLVFLYFQSLHLIFHFTHTCIQHTIKYSLIQDNYYYYYYFLMIIDKGSLSIVSKTRE